MSVYDFNVKLIDGKEISLDIYQGEGLGYCEYRQ